MSISIDGNDLVWDGEVRIGNFVTSDTGVVTLTLTPAGGLGDLPVFAQGVPGLPPIIDSATVEVIAPGDTVPPPEYTRISPGGPGTASHYTVKHYVPKGDAGAAGSPTNIGSAPDVTGTPTDKYTLVYASSDSKYHIQAQKVGETFSPSSITSYSGNASSAVLATLNIPALPFDWRPQVSGFGVATGTANTHVELQVRINNSTTGDIVGAARGITGAGSGSIPAYPLTLVRAFGGQITGSYGKIAANSAATIYFMAVQSATTTDAWSVVNSTCNFSIKVDPVP